MMESLSMGEQPGVEQDPVHEEKLAALNAAFVIRFDENLRAENLTLEQLDRLITLANSTTDDVPIDYFIGRMDDGRNGPDGSETSKGLRGEALGGYDFKEKAFSRLVVETFKQVHEPTLKSKLPRHRDGITYEDVVIVPDILQVLTTIREDVAKTQENDVEQVYDKKILESFVNDIEFQPTNGLSWFFGMHHHDKFPELMGKKIKDLSRIFSYSAEGYFGKGANTSNWGAAKVAVEKIINTLGPDVSELPVEELYRLIKNKVDAWDKQAKDKAAMRAFDPEI